MLQKESSCRRIYRPQDRDAAVANQILQEVDGNALVRSLCQHSEVFLTLLFRLLNLRLILYFPPIFLPLPSFAAVLDVLKAMRFLFFSLEEMKQNYYMFVLFAARSKPTHFTTNTSFTDVTPFAANNFLTTNISSSANSFSTANTFFTANTFNTANSFFTANILPTADANVIPASRFSSTNEIDSAANIHVILSTISNDTIVSSSPEVFDAIGILLLPGLAPPNLPVDIIVPLNILIPLSCRLQR